MNIIWLGHSGFRIEISDQVFLVDPWLKGNPVFPADSFDAAIEGVTHILLTHGHGDHASNAAEIARKTGAPIACIHELSGILGREEGVETIGFGKGGTLTLGDARVTLVHALHSSSIAGGENGPIYAGGEAGLVIRGEGHSIYVSGDTDVMADMAIIAERYAPDIGILCAGGHYTMDMEGAAYAARKFFNFSVVIPCHYKTFPLLAQNADDLRNGLPIGVRLIEPVVLEPISL